ncbi:MAG: hypothetical protein E6247_29985, partial [Klebsiella variicola]|nr:hypothetical protein [Klebsiella variicola]
FVHGGDLWRFNTPLSCLQPPQQGKTLLYTVVLMRDLINTGSSYRSDAPTQHNDYSAACRQRQGVEVRKTDLQIITQINHR